MKAVCLLAFLICSSYVFGEEEWTYVNREEKVSRYQINSKGKLHVDGQVVEGFLLQQTADRIGISPSSPGGKYAIILAFGDQDSQTSVLQFDKRAATIIPLQGTPMVWHSWSSDGTYLLLSSYTDKESTLYSIPVASFQPKKIPIQLHKAGEKVEFVTTTVNWTSPDTFQMEATIHCASGTDGCDSRAEEKVLRVYKLTINAASLQVTPEEQHLPEEEM